MNANRSTDRRRSSLLTLGAAALLSAAIAGPAAVVAQDPSAPAEPVAITGPGALRLDFATYNPLSLVIKDQGWLESALTPAGVTVEWVQSAGSNKANEGLRTDTIDIGSTAGSAALLARSNGAPIQVIEIFSQPEWAAIVIPAGSPITSVADLAGKRIAATKGTDPYFFLLQSLEEAGVPLDQVTVEVLQHADGWAALQNGAVDAWAGLDPIMAGAEQAGATLLYRNIGFNSYGFLNANEAFLAARPDLAQIVVDAYERARIWAAENPAETAAILAELAGLDISVIEKVLGERTNLAVDPVPGQAQIDVLTKIGPVFVESGDVSSQESIDAAIATIINDTFITQAVPSRFP